MCEFCPMEGRCNICHAIVVPLVSSVLQPGDKTPCEENWDRIKEMSKRQVGIDLSAGDEERKVGWAIWYRDEFENHWWQMGGEGAWSSNPARSYLWEHAGEAAEQMAENVMECGKAFVATGITHVNRG